ncbi:MAG TPA: F0F1 ATP synthase subunit delta [Acidimicrobiales bacterium]|nr:F0F1 ATP synthase subunit delta [Acidimicrobiales bacterium]
MNPSLQGYVAAVLDDPRVDVQALAADLAAVDRLFADNTTLRTALSDTAVAAGPRRAVLAELLAGRVSDVARRAAAFAVGAVGASEVPAAIHWLALRAHQAAEGQVMPESVLGHQASRERVGGFAAALFEEVPPAELEEVEDELFRFARTVDATPALRRVLTDRDVPVEARLGVVDELLAGKVRPTTLRLVDYVLVGGRPRDTVGILDWLVEETARARGWRVARVRAAAEIDEAERERLTRSLSELAGTPVELQVTVDPSLLAGVVVQIGDLHVEASVRGRLQVLREHMASPEWERTGFGAASGAAGEGRNGRGGARHGRDEGMHADG